MDEQVKFERLTQIIRDYGSVLVAFSGGTDSAFVLKVARDVLGPSRVKAATGESDSVPRRELEAAKDLARELEVQHKVIPTRELQNPSYRANSTHRCYFCKTELYDQLMPIAKEWNLQVICNGTNADDLHDFRPGLVAAEEHGIRSPLVAAGLGKDEIRKLGQKIGLRVWNKPASPCLSSRFPYGRQIASNQLKQVETGENFLKDLGFRVVRLRHFGERARVELGPDEFIRVMNVKLRDQITRHILSLGFKTVYFEPYRSGRLNQEVSANRDT